MPDDSLLKHTIDDVARLTAKYGSLIERILLNAEDWDKRFSFLAITDSAEHKYYKYKVLSLILQESQVVSPSMPVPACFGLGKRQYFAPVEFDIPDLYEPREDLPALQAFIKRSRLGFQKVPASLMQRTHAVLDSLTEHQESVQEAMVMFLDNPESAACLSITLCQSIEAFDSKLLQLFTDGGWTFLRSKLSRFLLASDILRNCTLPTVLSGWVYRDYFRLLLPKTCRVLGTTLRQLSADGTLAVSAVRKFRTSLKDLFAVWRDDALYPHEFMLGLQLYLDITLWQPEDELDKVLLGLETTRMAAAQEEVLSCDEGTLLQKAETYGLDIESDVGILRTLLCELTIQEISVEVSLYSKRVSDAWLRGVSPEQVQKIYRILEDEEFPGNFVKRLYTNQPSQLAKIYEEMMGVLRSLTTSLSSMLEGPSDALDTFRLNDLDRSLLQLEQWGHLAEGLEGQKLPAGDGALEPGSEELLPEAPETTIPQDLSDWKRMSALKMGLNEANQNLANRCRMPTLGGNIQNDPLVSRFLIMLQAPAAVGSDSESLSSSKSGDFSSESDSNSESSGSRDGKVKRKEKKRSVGRKDSGRWSDNEEGSGEQP